ncbi:hypothetical protein [Leekyejoonella antrihumi]|nr:hypothetical protein [Leekyejoonella antrihumi]
MSTQNTNDAYDKQEEEVATEEGMPPSPQEQADDREADSEDER